MWLQNSMEMPNFVTLCDAFSVTLFWCCNYWLNSVPNFSLMLFHGVFKNCTKLNLQAYEVQMFQRLFQMIWRAFAFFRQLLRMRQICKFCFYCLWKSCYAGQLQLTHDWFFVSLLFLLFSEHVCRVEPALFFSIWNGFHENCNLMSHYLDS